MRLERWLRSGWLSFKVRVGRSNSVDMRVGVEEEGMGGWYLLG